MNTTKRFLTVLSPTAERAPAFVVYRGPSALNGAPIVAILTGLGRASKNTKTGHMAQLWILADGIEPHAAQQSGADAAVCGSCPLRPANAAAREGTGLRACYVRTFQGPLATYRARHADPVDLDGACAALRLAGVAIRLGAYGDPAALPQAVVTSLARAAGYRMTGYSHAWREPRFAWLASYIMASVETTYGARAAHAAGWRTFRVMPRDGMPLDGEILCPSQAHGVKCADCRLCDGARSDERRKSIAIHTH